jgi:hypothetical protein
MFMEELRVMKCLGEDTLNALRMPNCHRRVESNKGVWDVGELTLNACMKMFIEELRAIRV